MRPNSSYPRVLIVGGGIGGLAAATALCRAGCQVDLVELKPAWSYPGVGIIQPGNALRALATLGLAQACLQAGFAYAGYDYYHADGRLMHSFAGEVVAPDLPAYNGILRADLHRILLQAAEDAGTRIRLGTTAVSLNDAGNAVQVEFSDGSRGDYALVVGADGVSSPLRARLFGAGHAPRPTGQSVWRLTMPRPADMQRGIMMVGPVSKAGYIPLNAAQMYLLLVTQEPPEVRLPREQLPALLLQRLRDFGGMVERTRQYVLADSDVVYRPLEVVQLPSPWHRGRTLLIGDAAHASTPHLGQGAALAIEDAVVLGELVAAQIPAAELGEAYMQRRFTRALRIQNASFTIGEYEQGRHPDLDLPALLREARICAAEPI
ncbi:MAG: FAD-dependent monooxygenase [Burkholderiaceae bacterium]